MALRFRAKPQPSATSTLASPDAGYLIELATEENTLLALEPMRRMVPTTITRITASITAYSAMSCPCSSRHRLTTLCLIDIVCPPSHPCGLSLALSYPRDTYFHFRP